jgi:hypothetical protein
MKSTTIHTLIISFIYSIAMCSNQCTSTRVCSRPPGWSEYLTACKCSAS